MPQKVYLDDPEDELASAQDLFHFDTVHTLSYPVLFAKTGENKIPYALADALSIVRNRLGGPLTRAPLAMEDMDAIEVVVKGAAPPDWLYEQSYKTTLNRLLVYNCESGSCWRVRSLIAAKASVETLHPENLKLPLQIAMAREDLSIFYALLGSGADLTKKNGFGHTAFCIAVEKGDIELVRRIHHIVGGDALKHDAERALEAAIGNGNIDMVAVLIEELKLKLPPHQPLMRIAIEQDNLEMVQYLVQRGKADVRLRSKGDGRNAIVVAAAYGHVDIVRFLCTECDAYDPDALFAAAQHDRAGALLYLLSFLGARGEPDACNLRKDDLSLMAHALRNGAYGVMHALARLERVDTTDALFYAVEQNRHELVRILMPGAKRVEDNYGPMQDTLLTWAIENGSHDCIAVIVKLKSHLLLRKRPSDDKTPKILAHETLDPECIRKLEYASRKTSFPTSKLRKHAAHLFAQAASSSSSVY